MATWVTQVLASAGYAGLVFLMFAENVFPPIPSELIVPLAGYMASSGKLALAGVIAAGTLGSVLGALPLYYFGRKLGYERTLAFARNHGRWLTVCEPDIRRAKRWFDRHGGAAVFFCRLVPGIRSLISLPAGIGEMNLAAFIVCTGAGSALWTALLAVAGYLLGRNFRDVEKYLDPVSWVVVGGVVVLYVVRVVRHSRR
ncbi:MAG: DedA family protein [Steroidobacteraceae bacterium]|jgi:membrane protein DedA with SNARE-associated domain|nr:DedA family protein [Steroidobacteraceae bacterium]